MPTIKKKLINDIKTKNFCSLKKLEDKTNANWKWIVLTHLTDKGLISKQKTGRKKSPYNKKDNSINNEQKDLSHLSEKLKGE